jgi:hypothetical protein
MKYLLAALLLGVFNTQAQTKDEIALGALHEKKFDWLIHNNADSLTILLDDKVQYIHSNGWVETKQEILEDLKSGKLNYQSVTVKDAKVRIYENTGVVNGTGAFKVLLDGKTIELNLLYTEVYVRQKKQWRLVSRHACRV